MSNDMGTEKMEDVMDAFGPADQRAKVNTMNGDVECEMGYSRKAYKAKCTLDTLRRACEACGAMAEALECTGVDELEREADRLAAMITVVAAYSKELLWIRGMIK